MHNAIALIPVFALCMAFSNASAGLFLMIIPVILCLIIDGDVATKDPRYKNGAVHNQDSVEGDDDDF